MIELLSTISGILAIAGVILNNYKLRVCFLVWIASNAMSAFLHIDAHMYALATRDVVFFGLAVWGYWLWR